MTSFEKMLEAVPDALVGTDQKGMIRFVNRQTESLFGFDRDDLIGQHIEKLVPESLWQIYASRREDYFADRRTRSSELELELTGRRKDDDKGFLVNVSMSQMDTGDVLLAIRAVRDVARQRQAAKHAQLMAAVVESSTDAIIGSTLEGIVTSWNPAAERMYGYTSREMIGRSADLLAPGDRTAEVLANLAMVKLGQHVEHFETTRVRKDLSLVPVSLTVAPIRDENGEIVGASAVHRDATEQRRAFEVAQRMEAIVESSDDAIIGRTIEGIITTWNPAAERMYGYSSQEIIGTSINRLVPEDEMAETRAVLAKIKAGLPVERLETMRVRKDGTVFPVSLTVSPIRDPDGEIVGASGIHRDVTEQRRAVEVAQRLAAIVESAGDAIIGRTLEGIITYWNPAAERLYGYTKEEIVGTSFDRLVPEDRLADTRATVARIRAGQQVERFDTIRVRKDGTLIPASVTISPIHSEDGAIIGFSSIHGDVSEQRRAFEVAQRMAAIIENSDDAIIGQTLEGIITSWNPAAERKYGYSSEEMIGEPISLLMPADRRNDMQVNLAKIRAGQHVEHHETIRVRKDGTRIPISLTISPIRYPDGEISGASGIGRDLTEQELAAHYARSLIEASLDPLVTISPEGKIDDVNEATIKATGVPRDKLLGTDFSSYFTDPDKAHLCYRRVFAKGSVTDYPLTLSRRDGTLTDVLCNASVYRDAAGNVLGVLATARDTTKQKEAFDAAQRMEAIVEYADEAIIGSTLDHVITSWNPAAERMFGYSGEEIVGKSATLITPKDRSGEAKDIMANLRVGKPVEHLETMRIRKDGTVLPVSLIVAPIRDAEGGIVGVSTIARDIVEQK